MKLTSLYRSCWRITPLFSLLLLLSACATQPPSRDSQLSCSQLQQSFSRTVARAGVGDRQAAPIDAYPLLRVDRFLASFRTETLSPSAAAAWQEALRHLGEEGRWIEWSNLPTVERTALQRLVPSDQNVLEQLTRCARSEPLDAALLRKTAVVPDEYRTLWRVLGLYPLTSLWVAHKAQALRQEMQVSFTQRFVATDNTLTYAPANNPPLTAGEVAELLQQSANNPLALPKPQGAALQRLLSTFAPVWQIEQQSDNDLIGKPIWRSNAEPTLDTTQPTLYTQLSYTRFQGQLLLQLNYTLWFVAHPCNGRFDIYCGKFDGITWRITLDRNGQPLAYDTMHNCGCYHLWLPTSRLRLRNNTAALEPPFVPQRAPDLLPGERIALHIASGTHFIEQIGPITPPTTAITYSFADYNELRSLPLPSGERRSLFNESGIITSSQRAERWLLWPMGVPSAGAMRQWGHHAIVFAGRRHFDDPSLLDQFFERAP
ncbi:MAG: hypothetical protein FD130_937 [Halothiobacillaceae bacterium]|nr:MAG: hypothetical protein FD130_937 [Halothiobacillaceae bacterium]